MEVDIQIIVKGFNSNTVTLDVNVTSSDKWCVSQGELDFQE